MSLVAMLIVAGILAFAWARKVVLTYALILANVIVLVLQVISQDLVATRSGHGVLVEDLAFRTAYLVDRDWSHMHTVVTSAFLHGGLLHLIGNSLVIFIAGVPFEERLGRGRFLALYFFSAVTAVLLHGLWTYYRGGPEDLLVPALGASGAAFGILGGFAATYPNDKFPIFPIPLIVFTFFARNVPVLLGVLLLVAIEGFSLFAQGGGLSGVANAAHIGGALGGTIAGVILKRPAQAMPNAPSQLKIDYATLERLAVDDRSRGLVQKVRENSDTHELQRAWMDRLVVRLRCPQCGEGYSETHRGVLECDNGHRERYAL
jgi:membrane associated rhomboid family serine protease